jgi:hypothetical protein
MKAAKVECHLGLVLAGLRPLVLPVFAVAAVALLGSCTHSEAGQPDLPKRPDVWVTSVSLDADSRLRYIGKTKDYLITTTTTIKDLKVPRTISVGDTIEDIRIGAIRCSFFWRDEFYGSKQYMWRGRWGCQAGRSREEIENSLGRDGGRRFDLLSARPVSLKD